MRTGGARLRRRPLRAPLHAVAGGRPDQQRAVAERGARRERPARALPQLCPGEQGPLPSGFPYRAARIHAASGQQAPARVLAAAQVVLLLEA